MSTLVLLAGPNGAGKTTFINGFLRERAEAFQFVNPDEVARSLPHSPGRDLAAGRLVLERLEELTDARAGGGREPPRPPPPPPRRIRDWKAAGYRFELVYLRLPSVEASVARVAHRVARGGHGIPEETLRRRYPLSLDYLETVYKPLADSWQVYASGGETPELLDWGPR